MSSPFSCIIILISIWFVGSNATTTNMFIFWGYPTDGTSSCVSNSSSSFDACIATCNASDTCLLAYGNDSSCMLCDLFVVTSIAQSDSSDGVKTAIKVNVPTDGCPSDMETEGYTGSNVNNNTYSLTYSGGVWTIVYDDSWTKFYRPLGQWCMKVLGGTTPLTRDTALQACNATGGAILSGLQSTDEVSFVTTVSKSITGDLTTYLYTGTWMDGVRLGACNCDNAETLTQCAGLLAFAIVDKFVSSYSAYTWFAGMPTSAVDRGTRPNCLALLVSQSHSTYQGTTYDNVCALNGCNAASSPTVCMTTYVCGIAAS